MVCLVKGGGAVVDAVKQNPGKAAGGGAAGVVGVGYAGREMSSSSDTTGGGMGGGGTGTDPTLFDQAWSVVSSNPEVVLLVFALIVVVGAVVYAAEE